MNARPVPTPPVALDNERVEFNRILVLEDDVDFASVLADYLLSVPYEVMTVSNGIEGLHAVLSHDFDAVVCDMMMPLLAGDLFYLAVERAKPHLCSRFVFMTGYTANPKIDYFIKEIGGTILPKPFHMEALRDAIEYVVPNRRRHR